MKEKRRLKGYQHLSASGHLGAVLEGGKLFEGLKQGIHVTYSLFHFLDSHVSLLDPENTEPMDLAQFQSLQKEITNYAVQHADIERSQILFVLTILRAIDEIQTRMRGLDLARIKADAEAAGLGVSEYWFTQSEQSQWNMSLLRLFFTGRKLRDKSPYLRQHLWALAGRALKHIIVPFYQVGRDLETDGWWRYFVLQGWVTPLCHLRHPYDASHAEEWRRGILSAIVEDPRVTTSL